MGLSQKEKPKLKTLFGNAAGKKKHHLLQKRFRLALLRMITNTYLSLPKRNRNKGRKNNTLSWFSAPDRKMAETLPKFRTATKDVIQLIKNSFPPTILRNFRYGISQAILFFFRVIGEFINPNMKIFIPGDQ